MGIIGEQECCFYCGIVLIKQLPNGEVGEWYFSKSSKDHYYPKNHPDYDKGNIVISCMQCNCTKASGDPEEYIDALKKAELPVWGERGGTHRWYKQTGYDYAKYD